MQVNMKNKVIRVNIPTVITRINGKQPTLRMYDELDGIVWTYGKEAFLRMWESVKPKHCMNMDKYIVYGTR